MMESENRVSFFETIKFYCIFGVSASWFKQQRAFSFYPKYSQNLKFAIQNLMEGRQPVVLEKNEFDDRQKPLPYSLFGNQSVRFQNQLIKLKKKPLKVF